MIRCFLNYCLPTLKTNFIELLREIPDHHKKAIIACYIAAYMVYKKGLDWSPSIVDIIPLILTSTSSTGISPTGASLVDTPDSSLSDSSLKT